MDCLEIVYTIADYFSLNILPETPLLGREEQPKAVRRKRNRQRFGLTLVMYIGVFLGVIGEHIVSLFSTGKPLKWASFNAHFLIALVITTVIFPQVFTRIFAEGQRKKRMTATDRFLQFCVAFQNGYFWPSLIRAISQMMR